MAPQRYDLKMDLDKTWTVFDVFTGLPVDAWGVPAVGLDKDYADDLVALLNSLDLKRRVAQGDF
ncbi:hypothetical protein [Mesorhizobium sp. ORM16]|uniref:hypothetical protein n=1 Tax=Mesorhizobium sp. ORM16 TaxID=3376989 RepID=UPI003857E774